MMLCDICFRTYCSLLQILRAFEDDEAGCYVVYAKKVMMA